MVDFVLGQGSILLLSVIRKEKILFRVMSNGAFSDLGFEDFKILMCCMLLLIRSINFVGLEFAVVDEGIVIHLHVVPLRPI